MWGAVVANEPVSELWDLPQAPPVRHAFAPDKRLGVDAACVEGAHQLPQVHGDRFPARDVHEPSHRPLNRPGRMLSGRAALGSALLVLHDDTRTALATRADLPSLHRRIGDVIPPETSLARYTHTIMTELASIRSPDMSN
jgi:hypothetical protein